jgi:two-component system response regulator AtoC
MNGDEIEVRALPRTGELSIGRADTNDIQIQHPSISRTHLVLRITDGGIALIDRGGSNGTILRGIRVPSDVVVEVAANEAIGVGDLFLAVQELHGLSTREVVPESSASSSGPHEPLVLDRAMRRLYDLAARVARGTISVLIVGETGTGKEVLAEYLHRASPRSKAPLVRVNCGALSEGLVESELFGHEKGAFTGAQRERRGLLETADGGTVVLDEIGEMPIAMQVKLLRVLEDGAVLRVGGSTPIPIDVRFVASTNRDLETEIATGGFRRDLYFRLAGAVLAIPALRERPEEIVALANSFVEGAAKRSGGRVPRLDDAAITALRAHAWPGNVRELRNVIERAVLIADGNIITTAHLAVHEPSPTGAAVAATTTAALPDELAAIERQRIIDALDQCGGNQTRAAKSLGMPLRTFIKRIESYGVPRPRKR